jgi:transposase
MITSPVSLKITKAAAVLKLLQKGYSAKDIQEQLGVSLSYVHMLKKKLAEGVGEAVETVRQTAAEHTNKVKEMIEDWRAEAEEDWKAEADTDVDTILNERATTYGRFVDVAEIAQEIKATIRIGDTNRSEELPADQIEALDMIASKIARILSGDSDYADSWIDIAGYATLVAERIKGKTR